MHIQSVLRLSNTISLWREAPNHGLHGEPLGKALPCTDSGWHQSWSSELGLQLDTPNSSFQKSLSIIKYLTRHTLLIIQLLFGYLRLSSERLPEKCSASLRRDLKASRFLVEKK